MPDVDWSKCPEVERVPGRRAGEPVLRGSRVTVAEVMDNYANDSSPEEISENFGLPMNAAQSTQCLLAFGACLYGGEL